MLADKSIGVVNCICCRRHDVIVNQNRQNGIRITWLQEAGATGRVRKRERQCFVCFYPHILSNEHVECLARFACCESQRTDRGSEITPRRGYSVACRTRQHAHGGAVIRGCVINGHRHAGVSISNNCNGDEGISLDYRVIRLTEFDQWPEDDCLPTR